MMTKRQQIYYLFLNLLSAILLVSETTSGMKPVVLVLLSLLMIPKPITLLPMLFVSSWSITFVAFPGLAAFFYYLILFLVSVLFSNRRSRTFTSSHRHHVLFALLFAIWIFATGFMSISGDWYGPMKISLYIVPLVLFSRLRLRNMDFLNKSVIVITAFFSMYFLFISWFAPVEFVPEQETPEVLLESFPSFRTDMNPNSASQIVLLVFIILYCGAFRTKKYWLIGFALMNIGSLMYLGSRTAFFAVCVIAIVYLMLVLKLSFIKKTIVLLAVATIFFGTFSMSNRFERAERLSVSSIQEDEGSGRFVTWKWLFTDAIPNNFIKGIGFGRENYEYFGFTNDADNMYVDVLCQTGIVGLVLFMIFYIRTIILLWKKRKINWDWDFLIAIFLAYLVEGWGESVFDTPMFWFCGLIAVFAINENNCTRENKAMVGL
jgi:O-antigen ligase